jgi:hypothetical protein
MPRLLTSLIDLLRQSGTHRKKTRRDSQSRSTRRRRLQLEPLEIRRLLASLTTATGGGGALPLAFETAWAMWGGRRGVALAGGEATAGEPNRTAWLWRAALAGVGLALILVFRSRQSLDFIYFQF